MVSPNSANSTIKNDSPRQSDWDALHVDGQDAQPSTTWSDLQEMKFEGQPDQVVDTQDLDTAPDVEEVAWSSYEDLEKIEETGVKSYKVFMRPPPIEKTTGLTDGEWREVSARFDDPDEWHPERAKLHESILTDMLTKADALSARLRQHEIAEGRKPTIYCLRGTCGSGKTTTLRGGLFNGILDNNGEPSGTLAPDVLKTPLRENGKINHVQVHDESCMLSRQLTKKIHERAQQDSYSMVYDKLMAYSTDFEDVFNDAAETERDVAVLDMDVPLELSAIRVLSRERGGEDPAIDFDGVANAFSATRKNRSALFTQVAEHSDSVSAYTLRAFDPQMKQTVEVAKLEQGQIQAVPGYEALTEKAVTSSDAAVDSEIEAIKNTVITEEYIAYFQKAYFNEDTQQYAAKNVDAMREYIGKTIGEALDNKAK